MHLGRLNYYCHSQHRSTVSSLHNHKNHYPHPCRQRRRHCCHICGTHFSAELHCNLQGHCVLVVCTIFLVCHSIVLGIMLIRSMTVYTILLGCCCTVRRKSTGLLMKGGKYHSAGLTSGCIYHFVELLWYCMGDLARLLHVYVYHVVGLPYAGFLHCCCVEGSAVMQPGCECQSVGLPQYITWD